MEKPTLNGVRVVTLHDVALRAGVSVSTASRALTGARRVTPTTAARVQSAARALGYRPNEAARNLRLSRTMTIGCVYAILMSPVYLDFLEGFGSVCQERGYSVISATARGDAALYRTLVHQLFERRVDALVVVLPPELGDAIRPYGAAAIPVLSVFSRGADADQGPLLRVDEDAAIAQAVTRLRGLGHQQILYLATPEGARSARAATLKRETSRAGMGVAIEAIPHAVPGSVVDAAIKRQRIPKKTTAVLVDQPLLPDLAAALTDAGVAVPDDASVITFAEGRWVRSLALPWSTIRLDLLEVGQQAAQLVLAWLNGACPPWDTIAGTAEFVERPSIGPARSLGPPSKPRSRPERGGRQASLPGGR